MSQIKNKILVIAGGGIRLSNQVKSFNKFIRKTNMLSTWPAQDICDHSDKIFGSIGRHAYKCTVMQSMQN